VDKQKKVIRIHQMGWNGEPISTTSVWVLKLMKESLVKLIDFSIWMSSRVGSKTVSVGNLIRSEHPIARRLFLGSGYLETLKYSISSIKKPE
jgi:hypothetical protein